MPRAFTTQKQGHLHLKRVGMRKLFEEDARDGRRGGCQSIMEKGLKVSRPRRHEAMTWRTKKSLGQDVISLRTWCPRRPYADKLWHIGSSWASKAMAHHGKLGPRCYEPQAMAYRETLGPVSHFVQTMAHQGISKCSLPYEIIWKSRDSSTKPYILGLIRPTRKAGLRQDYEVLCQGEVLFREAYGLSSTRSQMLKGALCICLNWEAQWKFSVSTVAMTRVLSS